MTTTENKVITIETTVNAPVEVVWQRWTQPQHIIRWNNASPDWQAPHAQNDLRPGGRFSCRMEAKDGSFGFDFGGVYTAVEPHKHIAYTMDDNRTVDIQFEENENSTHITERFEAETTHSEEMQQTGWQSILDNFKRYAEKPKAQLLEFSITINAPVATVYNTMLADETYRQWTAPFCPTSYYKGSWEKGAKIKFIGADENGKEGGMVSRIRENLPNQFVSIEHLGMLDGDEEITSGEKVDSWAGALENYTFRANGDSTELLVDMDSNEDMAAYFAGTWPKALATLKEICETKSSS